MYVVWFTVELPIPNRGNVFYAMHKDVIDLQFLIRRRSESKHKHKTTKPRSRSLARLIFWYLWWSKLMQLNHTLYFCLTVVPFLLCIVLALFRICLNMVIKKSVQSRQRLSLWRFAIVFSIMNFISLTTNKQCIWCKVFILLINLVRVVLLYGRLHQISTIVL